MTLAEKVKLLKIPDVGVFSAIKISDFNNHRVGINDKGFPLLLISTSKSLENFTPIGLRYLKVKPNLSCIISEADHTIKSIFTVISFESNDTTLQEYFLKISEVVVKSIPPNPSDKDILDVIYNFLEVLKYLAETPKKSIQGLWAELFTILESGDVPKMLELWHYSPHGKFDFEAPTFKLEVKSTASGIRRHSFSLEQLLPAIPVPVFIISVFTTVNKSGVSLQELRDRIVAKITDRNDLISKLDILIASSLGNSLQEVLDLSFDFRLALETIAIYSAQEVPKIQRTSIPSEITDVKFKVDLSNIASTGLSLNDVVAIC